MNDFIAFIKCCQCNKLVHTAVVGGGCCSIGHTGAKFLLRNFTLKQTVLQTVCINLESLSLSGPSRPYLQTQTPGVGLGWRWGGGGGGWGGRLLYLEINTTLTAPFAMAISSSHRSLPNERHHLFFLRATNALSCLSV